MLVEVVAIEWQHLQGILHDIPQVTNAPLTDGQHVADNPINYPGKRR